MWHKHRPKESEILPPIDEPKSPIGKIGEGLHGSGFKARKRRPEQQAEIVGGNIDVTDLNELIVWENTLEDLGFTNEEIAIFLASNNLNQYLRDLAAKGKMLTEEGKKEEYRKLKEVYLKAREDSKFIEPEDKQL